MDSASPNATYYADFRHHDAEGGLRQTPSLGQRRCSSGDCRAMDPHAVRTQRDEVLWLAKSVLTTLNPKVDATDSSALQNGLGLPIRIAPPQRAIRSINLVPVARQTYPTPGETMVD